MKVGRLRPLVFIILFLLAAGAAGGFLWLQASLEESAKEYQAKIEASEKEYVAQLEQWLNRPDDPRSAFDAQVFLSAQILEKIADKVEGQKLQLGEGRWLLIDELTLKLKRGFPLIELKGAYHDEARNLSFGGEVAAVLELAQGENNVTLRIRPITVKPAFGIGAGRVALTGLLGDVGKEIAQSYAESWPGFELPVQTEVPLNLPEMSTEAVIKIGLEEGDPWIKVRLDFPNLGTNLKVVYRGLVFTADGIHLFADVFQANETGINKKVPSPSWQKMSIDQKLEAIGFGDRDLGARVAKRLFVFAVQQVDQQPTDNRVIRFQGVERFGNLVSGNVGPVYYDAWLQDPPTAKGSTQIANLRAKVSPDPKELVTYSASGVASAEGQLGIRASLGTPKAEDRGDQSTEDPVKVQFQPTELAISGRLVLTRDGDLPIIAVMVDPTEDVQVACRVKIPHLGHVTIKPKVNVPGTRMTRIKLPPSWGTGGELKIGDQSVPYQISVSQMKCVGAETYLELTANADLQLSVARKAP